MTFTKWWTADVERIMNCKTFSSFIAFRTAVKKMDKMTPQSPAPPQQAVIRDKDMWITGVGLPMSLEGN